MSAPTHHALKITKDTLRKVTVFNDRAELRREFTVDLAAGLNEVVIEHTNDESVRVTGRGAAVIEEVQVSQRRIARGALDTEAVAAIRKQKEELEAAREKVDCEGQIVQKQSAALDGLVAQVGTPAKGDKVPNDAASLEAINALFGFHREKVAQLREEFRGLRKEYDRLSIDIALKDHALAASGKSEFAKNVVVILEAAEPATVTLEVTYQVGMAGWKPLYDIRVDTKEEKTEMQLCYYANVHQTTGEDWEGAQLLLSTARPCVGGTIPELGTLEASFSGNFSFGGRVSGAPPSIFHSSGGLFGSAASTATATSSTTLAFGASARPPPPPPPMVEREVAVSEQTLSTEFAIARPCSIPADGAMHKVTIGTVTLEPQLVHESVPSMNPAAFLTASAVNSSQLPILAGPASVYLDGAFVAKTNLKAVSPGEHFTASLGVDPAVRIEYKPKHKYHEQVGLISKWSCTVNEQKIVVKNTRGDAVLLTIREQIPKSTDEKIKVKVLSPEAVEKAVDGEESGEKRAKEGARMLASHNLEWTIRMEKGSTQTLLVKYTIEHPCNEKVHFSERFG